jgi:plasmid stabilization system protein ParE
MRLTWSRAALEDVARLYDFLADKDPDAAGRAVLAIQTSVAQLADMPRMGRPVVDGSGDFREWPVRFGRNGYVVRYRVIDSGVLLLAVRHGREDG